jgi:hypothetical protein
MAGRRRERDGAVSHGETEENNANSQAGFEPYT